MDPARVTAVVCAYWQERFGNVDQIVEDILGSTVVPDTIIILNNNQSFPNRFDKWMKEGVKIVKGWNTETRGKYVTGLLAQADWYLLIDDDITVSPRTLEYLLTRRMHGLVTANRGICMTDDSFFNGYVVDADQIIEDAKVDSICGCGVFMSHSALVKMFAAEDGLRSKWPMAGDDILAGFANRGNVWVFPMHGDTAWTFLPDHGVALCNTEGYYEMRDEFTADVLRSLR